MADAQRVAGDAEHLVVSGYTFGPFRMDLSSYELLRDDRKVELTSKVFDTLMVLVRNRHRVVVKEELLSTVWPDTSVTDDSLIQSISALRRALGDDAANPKYVSTVARRGYRFIAPVVEWTEPFRPAEISSAAPTTATRGVAPPPVNILVFGGRPLLQWGLAGLALLTVGWLVGRNAPADTTATAPTGVFRFSQTAPTGSKLASGGALSPDGRHIVFSAEDAGTGRARLWVRGLDAEQPHIIEGTEGASRPFWAPDNQFIGYFADGKLKTVAVSGGRSTVLATVGPRPAGASWSPRGQIVYSTWLSGLSTIRAAGGTPARLTELGEQEVAHAWPQFLPDGDRFIYSVISSRGKPPEIVAGRLSQPQRTPVLAADAGAVFSPAGYLIFSRSGLLTAQRFDPDTLRLSDDPFTVVSGRVETPSMTNGTMLSASGSGLLAFGGATGESELAWFDRTGRRVAGLESSVALHNPVVSQDGRQVFGNTYPPAQSGIWVVDVERGATSRLIPDGSMPMLSPDGNQVGFSSTRAANTFGLYTRDLGIGTGTDTPIIVTAERKAITDWSRDGQFMVYQTSASETGQDLWAAPRRGSAGAFPLIKTAANEIQGRLSPDGRWIAYASDESGRWEVYVQEFRSGSLRQTISPAGGAEPQWRGDGRELYYLAEDHALMTVAVTSGPTLRVGKPEVLFRPQVVGEPTTYRSHYAVTQNGQRFLVDVMKDSALDPITILLNWTPAK